MPWRSRDAVRHTKIATTKSLQRQWMHVANGAKKRGASDAVAIQEANSVVRKNSGKSKGGKK